MRIVLPPGLIEKAEASGLCGRVRKGKQKDNLVSVSEYLRVKILEDLRLSEKSTDTLLYRGKKDTEKVVLFLPVGFVGGDGFCAMGSLDLLYALNSLDLWGRDHRDLTGTHVRVANTGKSRETDVPIGDSEGKNVNDAARDGENCKSDQDDHNALDITG